MEKVQIRKGRQKLRSTMAKVDNCRRPTQMVKKEEGIKWRGSIEEKSYKIGKLNINMYLRHKNQQNIFEVG